MLSKMGVAIDRVQDIVTVNVCRECKSSLFPAIAGTHPKPPKFSLRNDLALGQLPDALSSLTWLEEQLCARYRSTHFVFRLYGSDSPQNPYMARGNSCAHSQNFISVAETLPRTPDDVNGLLSVMFTGSSGRAPKDALRSIFRVRKAIVLDFLKFLKGNNPEYAGITISDDNLALYPDDDILPGLEDRVVVNQTDRADEIFDEETAGFEQHPASGDDVSGSHASSLGPDGVFIENMGTYDANSTKSGPWAQKISAVRSAMPETDSQPPSAHFVARPALGEKLMTVVDPDHVDLTSNWVTG